MIHIFFVPGMFGSTVEYVLRCYTSEYTPIAASISSDGSMHTFGKEFHLYHMADVLDFVSENKKLNGITTPMYPFRKNHLPEILEVMQPCITDQASCILIHADTLRDAELNLLFQYHKIANGTEYKLGLDVFCGENQHNIKSWNQTYQHWSEMHPWELREWFSIFYPGWVQEWIDSKQQVDNKWLQISNANFLGDPLTSLEQIINFCKLTVKPGLDQFVLDWKHAQQYIITEFDILDKIVHNTVNNVLFEWDKVNIIAEAIVQQRLRSLGYEIRCDGLNNFPTDSKTLSNLLEEVT